MCIIGRILIAVKVRVAIYGTVAVDQSVCFDFLTAVRFGKPAEEFACAVIGSRNLGKCVALDYGHFIFFQCFVTFVNCGTLIALPEELSAVCIKANMIIRDKVRPRIDRVILIRQQRLIECNLIAALCFRIIGTAINGSFRNDRTVGDLRRSGRNTVAVPAVDHLVIAGAVLAAVIMIYGHLAGRAVDIVNTHLGSLRCFGRPFRIPVCVELQIALFRVDSPGIDLFAAFRLCEPAEECMRSVFRIRKLPDSVCLHCSHFTALCRRNIALIIV